MTEPIITLPLTEAYLPQNIYNIALNYLSTGDVSFHQIRTEVLRLCGYELSDPVLQEISQREGLSFKHTNDVVDLVDMHKEDLEMVTEASASLARRGLGGSMNVHADADTDQQFLSYSTTSSTTSSSEDDDLEQEVGQIKRAIDRFKDRAEFTILEQKEERERGGSHTMHTAADKPESSARFSLPTMADETIVPTQAGVYGQFQNFHQSPAHVARNEQSLLRAQERAQLLEAELRNTFGAEIFDVNALTVAPEVLEDHNVLEEETTPQLPLFVNPRDLTLTDPMSESLDVHFPALTDPATLGESPNRGRGRRRGTTQPTIVYYQPRLSVNRPVDWEPPSPLFE